MSYRGKSAHWQFANKTLDWFSLDTEKRFKEHMKTRLPELQLGNYVDNPVTYTFNSLGFRCEEIDEGKDSIVFLGGSEVVGNGLHIEHSFTNIVAKELGLACYNLGQSAGANDTIYRLASYWLPKLKPKLVIISGVTPLRMEVLNNFLDNPIQHFLPALDGHHPFFKTWLSCEENGTFNEEKNKIAVDHICSVNNLKLLRFEDTDFERIDYARDFIHKGIESNKKFAQQILDLL